MDTATLLCVALLVVSAEGCGQQQARIVASPTSERDRDFFSYALPWLAEYTSEFLTYKIHIWPLFADEAWSRRSVRMMCALETISSQLSQSRFLQCQYLLPDPDDDRCYRQYASNSQVYDCENSDKGRTLGEQAVQALRKVSSTPHLTVGNEVIANPTVDKVMERICALVDKYRSRIDANKSASLIRSCEDFKYAKGRYPSLIKS